MESDHRSMKNVVMLDNYYCLEELKDALKQFVHYYNHQRYLISLNNLTHRMYIMAEVMQY